MAYKISNRRQTTRRAWPYKPWPLRTGMRIAGRDRRSNNGRRVNHALRKRISGMVTQNVDLRERCVLLSEANCSLKVEIARLKSEVNAGAINTAVEANLQIDALWGKINKLKKENAELTERANACNIPLERIQNNEKLSISLAAQLALAQKTIDALFEQAAKDKDTIRALNETLAYREKKLKERDGQIADLRNKLEFMKGWHDAKLYREIFW